MRTADQSLLNGLELSGVVIELRLIAAGSFEMGSQNRNFSEAPVHNVTIAQSFQIGKFPITQRQWVAVCGTNPATFQESGDHPVENVNWVDAVRFCNLASDKTGRSVRLPSEAEWEYACRAGTPGEFFFTAEGPFSDDTSISGRVRKELAKFAWFDFNSREATHPVGAKSPNPWGLHDMIGNVWEWCADRWHDSYAGASNDGRPWLDSKGSRPLRCLRGGAWDMNAFRCRSCYRSWDWESIATNRFGFRICVD